MIKFNYVKFKNFGSFGNYFTTIKFSDESMTLVSGSNGYGKSYALLDSITFGLFGKPFRKINIPQLVNSINKKNCVVEVSFLSGSDTYKIIRGLKPKKFEIYKNDELIKQNAKSKDYQTFLEDQILKMNYKSFTQIVTLGSSSFVPFMQLTPADRREVIEDILDINIFSTMNGVIKSKLSTLKETIINQKKTIEVIKEKVDVQRENIKLLNKKKKETLVNKENKILEIQESITELLEEVSSLESSIENLSKLESKQVSLNKTLHKSEGIIVSLIKKKKEMESNLSFYNDNVSCPTCKQEISDELKEEQRSECQSKIDELTTAINDLKTNHTETKQNIKDIELEIKNLKSIQTKISEKKTSILAAEKYKKSLAESSEQIDSFEESIQESEEKISEYEMDLDSERTKLTTYMSNKSNMEVLSLLLKDSGIKAKIIKNYLPKINEIINKYLNKMNFFITFTLDEEFNEEIKSRHRDTFSYMNFSEGEKSRIDLAILLAWREIARIKNSSHCNLLILDEVFDSSLDSVGVDDLMGILYSLSKSSNVFVITHKSDQLSDRFSKKISFNKKNNFSRIVSKQG